MGVCIGPSLSLSLSLSLLLQLFIILEVNKHFFLTFFSLFVGAFILHSTQAILWREKEMEEREREREEKKSILLVSTKSTRRKFLFAFTLQFLNSSSSISFFSHLFSLIFLSLLFLLWFFCFSRIFFTHFSVWFSNQFASFPLSFILPPSPSLSLSFSFLAFTMNTNFRVNKCQFFSLNWAKKEGKSLGI